MNTVRCIYILENVKHLLILVNIWLLFIYGLSVLMQRWCSYAVSHVGVAFWSHVFALMKQTSFFLSLSLLYDHKNFWWCTFILFISDVLTDSGQWDWGVKRVMFLCSFQTFQLFPPPPRFLIVQNTLHTKSRGYTMISQSYVFLAFQV